ncbi:MAG: YjeF-related protein [Myxococcales bacterium]|nr:YjeF-related protein [Myxococcales bacterium]
MSLLVTAAQMRALDRETIETIGVPGVVLMESAGRGVVDVMARHYELARARVVVFCGPGNNGGDGYVVARHLAARGADVTVGLLGERDQIKGDAKIHLDACARSGVRVLDAPSAPLHRNDLAIDAVFGTGLTRPVGAGPARDILARLRAHRGPVIAVDVPSGMDADRGVIGPCVRADHTVTFAFAKLGLVGADALPMVGTLHVADIGIGEKLARERGVKSELLEESILSSLRLRDPAGHKGTHGHVLVVAGSRGKTGAALLCGTAVLRSGAGLCTVAMPPEAAAVVEGRVPELMIESLGPSGAVQALLAGKRAAAIGPGISRDDASRDRIRTLAHSELPLVVDADALNAVAADAALLPRRSSPTVLTPHPGEAARLLGLSTEAIQQDRVGSARALADRFGAVVVLKGARTIIAAPDGRLAVNPTGNPGLGTGGTGDVLTGCIAAALARLSPLDAYVAACAAVYLHGAAGDRAAAGRSQTGLLASDVIDALPHLLAPR